MLIMPKPYPKEYRDDVVAVARKGEAPLRTIAKVNRPGLSGDSDRWEGWSHVRDDVEEVPA
jgi:hypothetical protein